MASASVWWFLGVQSHPGSLLAGGWPHCSSLAMSSPWQCFFWSGRQPWWWLPCLLLAITSLPGQWAHSLLLYRVHTRCCLSVATQMVGFLFYPCLRFCGYVSWLVIKRLCPGSKTDLRFISADFTVLHLVYDSMLSEFCFDYSGTPMGSFSDFAIMHRAPQSATRISIDLSRSCLCFCLGLEKLSLLYPWPQEVYHNLLTYHLVSLASVMILLLQIEVLPYDCFLLL